MADRMTRDQAFDAISDLALHFHNEMVRRGVAELSPEAWYAEFRAWLPSAAEFADDHQQTLDFLGKRTP